MTALDSFHPALNAAETRSPNTGCSAHYFEVSGSTLAAAWYNQGLRVIDASNARDLRQVGYYYVNGTDPETNPSSLSWDTAWRGNLVYLFDMDRGIEILRLKGGPHASAKLATRARAAARPGPPREGAGQRPHARLAGLPAVRAAVAQDEATRPPRTAAGALASSVATNGI